MGFVLAEDVAAAVRARVFAARVMLPVDEWIARNWIVQTGPRKGSTLDLNLTAYLKFIALAFANPAVTTIVIIGPAQSGKTELIFALIAWTMSQRPGTWMVMLPKADKAHGNNETRFLPSILANPNTAGLLIGGQRDQKQSLVRFRGGEVHWIGSESLSGAEGTPARYVWIDEYDRCDETGREKLEQRGKSFADKKQIVTGTPGMAGEGIDAQFQSCDVKWSLHVPCPHCLRYHLRMWDKATVVWEGGNDAPPEDVRRNAWYECPHCRGRQRPQHRAWQTAMCVWLAQGQSVGPVVREDGKPDQPGMVSGKVPEGGRWGVAFSGLDNELQVNPVGEVAAEFLRKYKSHGRPGEVWETETLGRPVVIRSRSMEVEHLRARTSAATHARGVAPADTVTLYAAMDVQTDRVYWMVAALAPAMSRISLLDWGEIKAETEAEIEAAIKTVAKKRYQVVNAPDIGVPQVAVDTGHKATELYRIKTRIGSKMRLVKGEASRDGKNKDLYRVTTVSIEGGSPLKLLLVNLTPIKSTLSTLLMRKVKKDDEHSDETLADEGMTLDLPRDADEPLLNQLCSERFYAGLWQLKRDGLPNHWWDCLVYLFAAAMHNNAREVTRRLDQMAAKQGTSDERRERRVEPRRDAGPRGILTG